ncbi:MULTISPECIES: TetR/AcrR family transcriptional regulator [Bacillus]|jgi:AcrR family transcriptional regulator|uniref:Transcription regulator (TetR/AcrR family) BH1965 n=2 Tax=Bacillus cereus group TaxID=86661 RepID=Q73EZ5_BACC1|nr:MULTISPECIES: TetR/AcrR family transcriptional regulator [Bacillus]AAS39148.1 transcription regulator (TetR/AcrR family) BH1965 [Bacillus cereus ATCC 10987]AIE77819.1 transcription regulator TetR/AcrR family protein [Bacillus cereus]KMQ35765.1 TetR family transcriptional regulator [Bacillus cereus]KXY75649.1 TetR family transcriptional regulator [Bacillus cereus]MCU5157201.1 TetR/AcrR family transcriptional regulator [Bacillus pacificus]
MARSKTAEKIIQAAIELVKEKGYTAATTKEIAMRAGVNEVTIFRNFKSKKGVIEAAVAEFSYVPHLKKFLQTEIVWELETDLKNLARHYHNFLDGVKDIIAIGIREAGEFPELDGEIAKIPQGLKEELSIYFAKMREKGNIIDTNIEAQVMNFIWINFGYFLSKLRFADRLTEVDDEKFIENNIVLYARALRP